MKAIAQLELALNQRMRKPPFSQECMQKHRSTFKDIRNGVAMIQLTEPVMN